ncbi:MAG: hypothetical protein ACTSSG_13990 [Candidatus Heimdallarchaeaceae archaeon]
MPCKAYTGVVYAYMRTKVTSVDAIFLEHLYKGIIEELERRKED